ncbi:MAG TPA: hypothetical protein PLJ35_08280 [Anaerolineae bacterium]|nr:hypothetical protein [Anaerolineae bacterium]HOQ98805.1 hypothetical protein [Anaerolineae bacterium]HPL27499.1 hypothetical protein [Anaerolineae bacterium]
MGRLILTTVGTSLFEGGGRDASAEERQPGEEATQHITGLQSTRAWDALARPNQGAGAMTTLDRHENALLGLYQGWLRTDREHHISAEVASLRKLNPQPEDRIVLLASDTVRGVVAARSVALLCAAAPRLLQPLPEGPQADRRDEMGQRLAERRQSFRPQLPKPLFEADLAIALVAGLTWDARLASNEGADTLFRTTGCHMLAQMVSNLICHREPQTEVICNITGGLKSAIPFIVLVASLYDGVRLAYLFEDSPELLLLDVPRLVPPVEVEECVGQGRPSPNAERHKLQPYFDLNARQPRLTALGEALRIALECH